MGKKGSSQELMRVGASDDISTRLARIAQNKTLGVPNWAWVTAVACIGLFHISK